jgi:signal transduction histidine kinase
VQNALAEGWADDPAYDRFELGSYIGAQVWVGTQRYGTFCFADDAARAEPFSDREKTFVELLTLWARYDLEQRRDKTRLERQNSRLDRFASVLSHDLRNPLNTAMMTLDLAREADDPRRPLDDIGSALDRMRGIIQDVLALTRDGDIPSDARTPVRLSSVIEASWSHVDTVRATLQNEASGTVHADETRLRRLLENLFRNAVEHGGSEAVVRTGLVSNGFFVADDGPGIPEEKREAVFDDGYSSRRDGTGLGLSIVETVAEAHGWSLSVTDSRTGGARFEIADMDLSQTAAAPSGEPPSRERG